MTYPQNPGDAHTTPPQPSYPAPPQWMGADGRPHSAEPTPAPIPPAGKSNRTPIIAAAVAAFAVLALAIGGYAVYDRFIKEDSGVAACKAMAAGKKMDGSAKDSGDDKLTEQEYRQARKLFEESRHDDIREHGTALLDVAWQVSQLDKGEEMGALAYMGPMTTHMSGLQTACADQGVIVNLNSK